MSVTRLSLWEAFDAASKEEDPTTVAFDFVLRSLNVSADNMDEMWLKNTMQMVRRFVYNCTTKLNQVGRHKGRFKEKFADWLAKTEDFPSPDEAAGPSTQKQASSGRPQEEFQDLSDRRKRSRTEDLRDTTSAAELTFAAQMNLRKEGEREAATIIQKTVEASPRTLKMFIDFIKSKETGKETEGIRSYTLEEALAYQFQCKLTKAQYIFSRQSLISHNAKVFPSYEKVSKYRKTNCYPASMMVTERKANVSLQSLLDHTVTRIVSALEEVLQHTSEQGTLSNVELISKIGFDSSSSHSLYNQR